MDVTLLCGRSEITLVRLIQGLRVFQKNNTNFPRILSSAPGVRSAERTAELWKRYALDDPIRTDVFEILSLVDDVQEHKCSDDRDRIFALYALAQNIRSPDWKDRSEDRKDKTKEQYVIMDIDYSLDVRETYTAFARACMNTNMGVRVLEAAVDRHSSRSNVDWSSWVPDWRIPRRSRGILYMALKEML